MANRKPSLTSKAVEGLSTVQYIAEASLESFVTDAVRNREYERRIMRGLKYIQELTDWYAIKQKEVSDEERVSQGGEDIPSGGAPGNAPYAGEGEAADWRQTPSLSEWRDSQGGE